MEKFSNIKNRKVTKINEQENQIDVTDETIEDSLEQSDIAKFFSKIFESKEMAHVYHLTVKGEEGSYSSHKALEDYYENILEHLDNAIEVYQGQYGEIIESYDIIDTSKSKDSEMIEYFEEVGNFILENKSVIPDKDTHTHSIIDEISILVYKLLYKLRYNR